MTKPTEIELHAGHAVKVKGAVGHIDEFTENRRVAKRVYEILTDAKVPATYYEDKTSTTQAQNINNLIKHHNADRNGLIVSIHFNAGGDGTKAIGTEVIYYNQKDLAAKVSKAISDATSGGLKNRGAKQRTDLGVLAKTYEPAILVEVCFVNSSVDTAIYRRDFDKICLAIAKELAAHIGKSIDTKPTDKKMHFFDTVKSHVADCWTKHQILPSVVMAQAILESGWGTSDKALKANNLFGIKAASDWHGPTVTLPTKEHVDGKWITVDAKWRKYDSWGASIVDHALFLKGRSRYSAIIGNTDYKSVCNELQKAGYATDPDYAAKLIKVIEANKLTQFDKFDKDVLKLNETGRKEIRELLKKARKVGIIDAAFHTDVKINAYTDTELLSYQAAVINRTFK